MGGDSGEVVIRQRLGGAVAGAEVGDEQVVDGRAQVAGESLEVGDQRGGRASVVCCERVGACIPLASDRCLNHT